MQKQPGLRALAIAAEREVERRPKSIAATRPERPTPSSEWKSRLGWMTAGALLAVAAFFGARRSVEKSPSPATPPISASNQAAMAAAAPGLATETEKTPAKSGVPAAARETPELAVQVLPTSDTFDPQLGGPAALAAAETCFTDERKRQGIDLGVSLSYGRDGSSKRVYFGAGKLEPKEHHCLRQSLLGLRAGAAPERPTSVSYSFWIGRSSSRFKARLE
jgi:hypothetical protein